MLQRSSSLRLKKVLQSVLVAAALGITAGAANAQYGSLPRLGGPLVVADYSGYGYNGGYGYSSPYVGSSFGYNGYTNGNTTVGLNNLPRNIAFDGTGTFGFGTTANTTVAGANQLINDPLTGFQQPRQIIIPTASGYVDANGNPVSLANITSSLNNGSVVISNTGLNGNTTLNDATNSVGTVNTNTGIINRMPSDGTIVPANVNGNVNGAFATPINSLNSNTGFNTSNGTVLRMPTDGSIGPASSAFVNGGFPAAFAYSTQQVFDSNSIGSIGQVGVTGNGFFQRAPSNGTIVPAGSFGSIRQVGVTGNGFFQRAPSNGTIVPAGSFGIQSSLRSSAIRTR